RHRALERRARELDDRHVVPAGQVRRREQHAALCVERAATADADGLDGGPLEPGLADHSPAELEEPRQRGTGAFSMRRLDRERMKAPLRVDDSRGELRAADVQRQDRVHQPLRPWVAIPSTKYRWPRKKTMIIGMVASTVAATITW